MSIALASPKLPWQLEDAKVFIIALVINLPTMGLGCGMFVAARTVPEVRSIGAFQ